MEMLPALFGLYILVLGVFNVAGHVFRRDAGPEGNARGDKVSLKEAGMEGKIVGGVPVEIEQIPYSGQIFNMGAMCAGTILNSWTLLTAAHCFDMNKDTDEIIVQVGSRYVYDFNADQFNVVHITIHERYNQSGLFACDIALLFVDRPITFSKKTKKAILVASDRWMNKNMRNFVVSGWGWTSYGGPISEDGLMMARLRFVPRDECSRLHNMMMSQDMFCLYGDGSRDTCKGDSGGGVFWNRMIVGITSHGDGCAKKRKPSVYANVYYFREWIQRNVMLFIKQNCNYIR